MKEKSYNVFNSTVVEIFFNVVAISFAIFQSVVVFGWVLVLFEVFDDQNDFLQKGKGYPKMTSRIRVEKILSLEIFVRFVYLSVDSMKKFLFAKI